MMIRTALAAMLLSACLMPPQSGQATQSGAGPSSAPDESQAPPPSSSSSSSSMSSSAPKAPAGPQTVSVTIRSACSKTAKVFYGEKPGFSSGTTSSISSNSVQSKTFREGDLMWVLDDAGKPLGDIRIESGTRNIEISSSCSSISSR
jgi:hypothetical protein